VKHKTRYVFFRLGNRILDDLAHIINESSLIRILNRGQSIWRVRVHDPDTLCDDSRSCGPPPVKMSFSSRMNPAGIPMFYGALEGKTALLETLDKNKHNIATISKWELIRGMTFLDLTKNRSLPSLFDPYEYKSGYRTNIRFLRSFVQELSQPIKHDGFEHNRVYPNTSIYGIYSLSL